MDETISFNDSPRGAAFVSPTEPVHKRDRTVETIGRFRLAELLGSGGMGDVYVAFDGALRRKVALKLLRGDAIVSEERRRRFLREARAAAAVSHTNIAAVFEVGEVAGEVFIAMERVEGRSLRAVLEASGAALPEAEAVRVAQEIARGLAAAHAAGVIHRDIKPENVMVNSDGRVKILDFGLAKLHGAPNDPDAPTASAVETQEGRVLGTPSYMSPEQARGRPADTRSDVFSLGVVLFEMLAGKRPFRGATAMDVLTAIMRDEPPQLTGVSEALAGVVARCLAKDPNARYEDAGALLAALDTKPNEARVPTPPSRRRRWIVAGAVVSAAMALGWCLDPSAPLRLLPSPPPPMEAPPGLPPPAFWLPPGVPTTAPPGLELSPTAKPPRTAITDLPVPDASNAEAILAYKAALQSFRDANWSQAEVSLRRAVELDPTLAAAQLRLAIVLSPPERLLQFPVPEARTAYREATRQRNALTPRDRALLTALEPALNDDPLNITEATRRIAGLTERYPLDAEIFFLLAAYGMLEAPERRVEAARRAVEIDPEYADAWQVLGMSLAETDTDGALTALERCTTIVPTALDCWGERAKLESTLGRCADAEAHFRRATSDPRALSSFFRRRAEMLYALGSPPDAVTEVLRQAWARLDPSAVARGDELYDRALLAAAYGDFDAARARAAEGLVLVDALPALPAHARFTLLLADAELEAGRGKKAGAVALDFLKRRDGWQLDTSAEDPTVYLARVATRSGSLSVAALRAQRDAWYRAAGRPGTATARAWAWGFGYAMGIEREDEAAEALAARPADARWSSLLFPLDGHIGRALFLGGKREDALPYLSHAFTRCGRLPELFSRLRTNLLFGRALDERGDRDRACEVYETILARWGTAKPRSVTAEEAKKRAQALRCDAAPR